MPDIVPLIGGVGFMLGAFVFAIMIIVVVHEYGHYIVARWCGVHSEVFSVGMGPSIWERRDRRGTLWRIAVLPIGGFVRFRGDGDASSTTGGTSADGTLESVPVWRRSAIVAAGPIANFLFAIAIFAGMVMWMGVPTEDMLVGEVQELPTEVNEIREGDRILSIEGVSVTEGMSAEELADKIPEREPLAYKVLRNGEEIDVLGPYFRPPLVRGLIPQGAAREADLQIGDVITQVEGEAVLSLPDVSERVEELEGEPVSMTIWRGGAEYEVEVTPKRMDLPADGGFEERWMIGINTGTFFETVTERPSLLQAILIGVDRMWYVIETSLSGIYHMLVGAISTCNLSGPGQIAMTTGDVARDNPMNFPWLVAVLSTAVGFMNLLPIPILDGGHLAMHAYEGVTRRKPSAEVTNILFYIGMVLIILIMTLAVLSDIICP